LCDLRHFFSLNTMDRRTDLTPQNVLEPGCDARGPTRIKANVARTLIAELSAQCTAYCILSGYDRLPGDFDTDIDFMVNHEDFERMPRIIVEVGRHTDTHLFQTVDHELSGRAYFLGSITGPSLTIVQPDCASDYRHFGRRWLSAAEVLAARRWHSNGFWIPSAAHEFAYYLIKRLNKRDFNREHGYKLHRLYVEDRIECGRTIVRFWNGPEGSTLVRMAAANDWVQMAESLETFRSTLMRSRSETLSLKLASVPPRALLFLRRIAQPTGSWIAFMGPDGCGKSLVINAVSRQFTPAFRKVSSYHMRPRVIGRKTANQGPVTDPHGQPARGLVASIAKVLDLTADYILGYLSRILPAVIRTQLVLFDRCFYDLLVDSKRIRYGGPRWLLRTAAHLAPRPDLVILLDAPPDVLWKRKKEVPLEEVSRQREAYLQLAQTLPSAVVVNAAQPPADVIHDVIAALVEHLARRARGRIQLPNVPGPDARIEKKASSQRW
jgi:thymidylate kinase